MTLVAGWWGFPWGPIYTLGALGTNAFGGQRPRDANAELLHAVGTQLLDSGNPDEAAKAFRKSLALEENPAVSGALDFAEAQRFGDPMLNASVSTFRPGELVNCSR